MGRFAAMLAGVPHIIFTEHGDSVRDPLRTAINRVLHARTECFVVFSEAQRADFAAKEHVPTERIRIIPNGVEVLAYEGEAAEVRAELGIAEGTRLAVIPARLIEGKNIVLAIEALALRPLLGGRPWLLALAGEGPDRERCAHRAAALGVAHRVLFLGYRADVPRLLRAADLCLMPSRSESMPLAVGEAMLARTPIVSAPWPYVASFIRDGETGFVSEDHSAATFVDAIVRTFAR